MFPRTKTGTRVHSDVPPERNRHKGAFACSPGTKTGTRAHSPKTTPLRNRPLGSPRDPWAEPRGWSAQGFLGSEIPRLRISSTEEYLGSGLPGHPRVVRVVPAGPKTSRTLALHYLQGCRVNHKLPAIKKPFDAPR